jgi:hypothetical protein
LARKFPVPIVSCMGESHLTFERTAMRRLVLAAAIASAVLVPAAGASQQAANSFQGTVVGKDNAHRGLIVALRGGAVRTVAAPRAFARTAIGRRVAIRFSSRQGRLPIAVSVTPRGTASHAVVRGTIVRVGKRQAVLSAGGSALTVGLKAAKRKRALASAQSGPQVGDTVNADVEIDDDGSLAANAITVVATPTAPTAGSDGELEVRGKVKGPLSPTSITVVTGMGVEVTCAIPAGLTLNVQVDAPIELKCDLIGATWTVRKVHGENDHGDSGDGDDDVEVHGTVTALTTTAVPPTITVTPTQGTPVTCTIPTGASLTEVAVNGVVKMECVQSGDTLTLKEIENQADSGQHHDGEHGDGQGGSGDGDDD